MRADGHDRARGLRESWRLVAAPQTLFVRLVADRGEEGGRKAFFRLAETEPESARSTAWVLKGEGHGGRLVSVHKYDDIAALYKKRVGAKAEKLHYPCTYRARSHRESPSCTRPQRPIQ